VPEGQYNGAMEIVLPGLKNAFDLPAKRGHLDNCGGLPNDGWYIGNKEVPGHQKAFQMTWGVLVGIVLLALLVASIIPNTRAPSDAGGGST
jgi:hypothetical protein